MVSNTTRLSALLFAHVLEEYVVFVEDRNLLDQRLPRYFPTFAIDVFFEHVCKMHVAWLLNRHTCSRNTANVLPRCTYFAHVFEKGAKFAAGRVRERSQVRRRAPPGGPPGGPPHITYSSMKSDGFEYDTSVSTFVCTRVREIHRFTKNTACGPMAQKYNVFFDEK